MKILGISAYYHDSAAAIVLDGRVAFAAQEERFSRIKNDASFPISAIEFCLEESGIAIDELDSIVFYDKPFLKFERLLETYYAFAPKGFLSFAMAMAIWLREKLFIKQSMRKKLRKLSSSRRLSVPIKFAEHHLSHAASAFYTSPYIQAAFLTIDAVGEWATTSYGIASGEKGIKILGEMHFPDSIGLLYSSFTYFLGFEVNSGEYKMMGLAPYGNPGSDRVESFIQIIKNNLVLIHEDGSIRLNRKYFEYAVGLRMVNPKKWEKLFGIPRRLPEDRLNQGHADFALAAQKVTEEVLIKLTRFVRSETGEKHLCLSGGVALNCVANAVLYDQQIFEDIYVQPAAGDAGGALGAALAASYIDQSLKFEGLKEPFNPYLGPRFSDLEIERILKKNKRSYVRYESEQLVEVVAEILKEKKVVGWFRGRTEFGPRALGNRSILADASDPDMQHNLNMKIKFREGFRPFAPMVCEEDYESYFDPAKKSHYMLFTSKVKESLRKDLREGFEGLALDEKRKATKSDLPAITHIDFSARVQVLKKEMNPVVWNLIQAFKKQTGVGVLVNTSFNVKDEPIVNSPEDAYLCFMNSEMDVLVLENYIIEK